MHYQLLDLPHGQLHREQAVQQAEGRGGAPRVAAHPWLDVVHVVVDLVHYLLPAAQLQARVPEVLRVDDVLSQHILHVERRLVAMLLHPAAPSETA